MHLRAQGHQGAYGPLRPPNKAKVPLWMAFNLKLKKKCHIVAPDWLNVGVLEVSSCGCLPRPHTLVLLLRISSGETEFGNHQP